MEIIILKKNAFLKWYFIKYIFDLKLMTIQNTQTVIR